MMTNRSIAVVLTVLATALPAAGCATSGAADGAAGSIAPGPSPLSGTWYGSGYEVGRDGDWPYIATYVLRIDDDGTATLKGRLHPSGTAFEYSGTATVQGDRVILAETNGSHWASLTWHGRTLYAMVAMSSWRIVRGPVAIEFHRAEDGS
jgi:hypothetical protein